MTSSVVALAVSPTRSTRSTPARRRQITPSAEASPYNHSLILTTPRRKPPNLFLGSPLQTQPYFAPRQLFPQGTATVQAIQNLHAHRPGGTTPSHNAGAHVLIPFDLRGLTISLDDEDVKAVLHNIFPHTFHVAEGSKRCSLLFQVDTLPKTPWPVTVGGVPITIATFTAGRDLSSGPVLRDLAKEVDGLFQQDLPRIHLLELMYPKDGSFYAILSNNASISALCLRSLPPLFASALCHQLPGRIANRLVRYMRDEDLERPAWADLPARRLINPGPRQGFIDDIPYEVENPAGDRFMTAASHGIGVDERAWQTGSQGTNRLLGKAVHEISFTDVSLVQLEQDVLFCNETFENASGEVPRFTRLFGEDPVRDKRVDGKCYLDSPYKGNMVGRVMNQSIKLERSSNPAEDAMAYVVYNWSYMGYMGQEEGNPDKVRPPDGTCGSVIWDDDGVVVGFFRYYIATGPFAGFAASVNASEVVKAGYRLAR